MSAITTLLSGGCTWIAGIGVLIAGLLASYFGGKKIGTTQTQAKADVQAAQKEQQQTQATAKAESDNIKVAKSVQQENASVSDDTARERMRQSKYHTDD